MNLNVREDYKNELLELACKYNRFNLKGFTYAPVKNDEDVIEHFDSLQNRFVSSPKLELSLLSLLKVSKVIEVYKFNKQNIDYLEEVDGVVKKRNKYILQTENFDDGFFYKLFKTVNEDEPKRGSIYVSSIINRELKEFIKNCYDPSFLTNLKSKISEPALKHAKKDLSDKIHIVFSYYGLDTVVFLSEEKLITDLFYYSCKNSRKSAQFRNEFCITD